MEGGTPRASSRDSTTAIPWTQNPSPLLSSSVQAVGAQAVHGPTSSPRRPQRAVREAPLEQPRGSEIRPPELPGAARRELAPGRDQRRHPHEQHGRQDVGQRLAAEPRVLIDGVPDPLEPLARIAELAHQLDRLRVAELELALHRVRQAAITRGPRQRRREQQRREQHPGARAGGRATLLAEPHPDAGERGGRDPPRPQAGAAPEHRHEGREQARQRERAGPEAPAAEHRGRHRRRDCAPQDPPRRRRQGGAAAQQGEQQRAAQPARRVPGGAGSGDAALSDRSHW